MTTSLSSRALLVSLSISQWTARKLDRQETAALAAKHGTASEVARVNKSLLPFAGALEAIHKKSGEARTFYYKNSLPWGMEGVNVIRSEGYLDFTQKMGSLRSEWLALVDTFCAEYPQLVEDAKLLLNTLWKQDDYPDASTIRSKFSFDVMFFPVPEQGDWRVDVGDEALSELRQQIETHVTESQTVAMQDAWRRVHETIAHARDRLSNPTAIFRDSLVENAQELCGVLSVLNIADDPNLEAMRVELEQTLCSNTPDTLRNAPDVRADVATKLAEMDRKMGAFYQR